MITAKEVNIAVLVLAILFEYRCKYRQYFSYAVSMWVSILLSSGALVESVNNKVTVTERVKTSLASKVDTATVLTR